MKLSCIILAASMFAAAVNATDPVLSPRAKEYRGTFNTAPGFVERKGFDRPGGKSDLAPAGKTKGKTEDRDLVRESRKKVYTGKSPAHPQAMKRGSEPSQSQ